MWYLLYEMVRRSNKDNKPIALRKLKVALKTAGLSNKKIAMQEAREHLVIEAQNHHNHQIGIIKPQLIFREAL